MLLSTLFVAGFFLVWDLVFSYYWWNLAGLQKNRYVAVICYLISVSMMFMATFELAVLLLLPL